MAKHTSNMRKLHLLMWKQYHLRKHRYIVSAVELLLPILVVYGIAYNAGGFIGSGGVRNHSASIPEPIFANHLYTLHGTKCIIYTPSDPPLKDVMTAYRDFMKKVSDAPLDIYDAKSESDLEWRINGEDSPQQKSNCVGIVFTDSSALTGNETGTLSYTLRSTEALDTTEVYDSSSDDKPVFGDPYRNSPYTAVQLSLNEAFMKYKYNSTRPLYEKVRFGGFPYPAFQDGDTIRSEVPYGVCLIIMITTLILTVPLITTIIEEKTSGVKELMKIVGMNEWLIWIGWFLYGLVFSLISYTVVTWIVQHDWNGLNSAPIRNVHPLILWSFIMLYCVANVVFAFTFAALFHQTTVASSVYVLVFALICFTEKYVLQPNLFYLARVMCLLPNAAFTLGFEMIKFTETHDHYVGWRDLFFSSPFRLSLGSCFLMLLFDTVLYLFLAYYISAINPGPFGARKSPFFIFSPLKAALKMNQPQELVNLDDPNVDKFIEKPPTNLEATIKIKDLHKNFSSVYAVRGVNLSVYKGEITALLGHNGAGKTTTLAILTGIMNPTEGSIVYKDRLDVLKNMDEFRQNLGMCAQEDRLFPYLSVLNHLLFFGQLKGESEKEARQEAMEYMNLMEIGDKAHALVSSLSGGMKRKLCLSIALMGKAETLILDEPTSGLDVESRRKLWDLLKEMRGNRTIILTTHHMEEADALGDRIAIMHHGTIVCHGTKLFLKKSYNTGYQVTVTKNENSRESPLTDVMQTSKVPDVTVESSTPREVIYKLPLTETAKFPDLFGRLETRRKELGIESIGVSCTTMEQVFLKVGGMSMFESKTSPNRTVTDGATLSKLSLNKKSGPRLVVQQVCALFYKKLLYTSRTLMNLFFKVIFPTFVMILLVKGSLKADPSGNALRIDFGLYPDTKIMVQNTSDSWPFWANLQSMLREHEIEVIVSKGANITSGLLEYAEEDLAGFKHDVILGMEMVDNDPRNVLVLYNKNALHSLPLGVNTFANNFVAYQNKNLFEFVMTVHPVGQQTKEKCKSGFDPASLGPLVAFFIALAFYTIDLNTYFMTAINVERLDGFKHIQLMSNVSPVTYWLGNFVFDYVLYFAIVIARIIALRIIVENNEFLSIDYHFCVLLLILSLFIGSCLLFTYVMTYLSNSKDGSYLLLFFINIVGAIVVAVMYALKVALSIDDNLGWSVWAILYRFADFFILLFPPMNYSMVFVKFFLAWTAHKNCGQCPENPCAGFSYFTSPDNGIRRELLFLVFDMVLYAALLCIIQMGYFEKLMNKLVVQLYGTSVVATAVSEVGDEDVQQEKTEVDRLTTSSPGSRFESDHVLIAHKLRKNFIRMFRPFTAVADVNFTVKAGECFGLLGVNGAGKSTTFKMLTGDLLPTKGDSSILHFSLRSNRTQYLSRAGYCAQSNCFLEELSGREMLELVASLRGIRSNDLKEVVHKWLTTLGLEEFQNQRCGGYSGGNKRKLCTAMSLIGDPNVVFLDEPTSGVDPVARRKLYVVMEQSRGSGQAVVLTSHSMEECENLCDRLTILVKGRMQCIGTAQHLKQTYAQGFTILVKILDTASVDAVEALKGGLVEEFNGQLMLKDAHKSQLYYQITDTRLLWSTLFEKMEKVKRENESVVEDYILSDTSLEEVFISFAKQYA